MVKGFILIILTGLLWCANGILISYVARKSLNFLAVIGIQALSGTLFVWFFVSDMHTLFASPDPRLKQLVFIMVSSGILGAMGMMLMQKAMRIGHHGIVFTVSQSSMIVPFLLGVIFYGLQIFQYQLAGLILLILSVVAFGIGDQRNVAVKNNLWLPFTLFSFLILGVHQSLATLPSYWVDWTDGANLRVAFMSAGFVIGYFLAMVIMNRFPDGNALRYGIISMPFGVPSLILFFKGIDLMAVHDMVAYAYPVAVGTCIISFVAYSLFFLKEKTPAISIAGVGLGVVGLIMISIK
ncbi:MAG: EamA family transporter [candidate division KSB1 bacterium]|jgi:drug/metabolite transporter (DMT)-like permease|nr:EamA family transporter [candidate division KSB1 bacterium]